MADDDVADAIHDVPDGLPRLRAVLARLRDPVTGCAWDLAQTHASIAACAVEEAYEVVDAIERGDADDLKGELGDLLLQVVYHSRLAEEDGAFDLDDVACAVAAKLITRHPHVFAGADATADFWEAGKAAERAARGTQGALEGVALALPALVRADKLQRRAARVGFDWPDTKGVIAKIAEEATEIADARERLGQDAVAAEVGDLLFAVANLARHLGVDPEAALAGTNARFTRRFAAMERMVASGGGLMEDAGLMRLEELWQAAKAEERGFDD
jgi:ATP diphosphatase